MVYCHRSARKAVWHHTGNAIARSVTNGIIDTAFTHTQLLPHTTRYSPHPYHQHAHNYYEFTKANIVSSTMYTKEVINRETSYRKISQAKQCLSTLTIKNKLEHNVPLLLACRVSPCLVGNRCKTFLSFHCALCLLFCSLCYPCLPHCSLSA